MAKQERSAEQRRVSKVPRLVEVHAWSADVHERRLCAVLHGLAPDGSPLRLAVDLEGLIEAATSLELKVRAIAHGLVPPSH